MRRATWLVLLSLMLARCDCTGLSGLGGVPGTLVGTLCDARTGAGSAGVEMAISLGAGGGSKRETSGAGGNVKMTNVPPGTYEVSLTPQDSNAGAARVVSQVVVKSNEETQVLDPACIAARNPPGTGWVRGHVCNRHTGSWVSNASVTVTLADGNLMSTTTDADGNFLLEAVPAGTQTVYVQSSGFSRSYVVTVVDSRESSLDNGGVCQAVDPSSGGVEGVFCNPNGTGPLQGATAYVEVGNPPVRISDTTDVDGHFILTGLPLGAITVYVEDGAYHNSYQVTIVAGTVSVIGPTNCIIPDPNTTGRIEGLFCSAGGVGPLVGASVTVVVGTGTLEDTTDANGHFAFAGVAPGAYTVVVHRAGGDVSYPVTVVAGATVTVAPVASCEVVAGPTGEIQGRICAPNGTTWLANARVWVDTPQGAVEATTDANGHFQLSGVPPGTYTVHVAAGTFTTDIPDTAVRSNEITTVGSSASVCVPLTNTHKIAVVTGDYDNIGHVLSRLGLTNVTSYGGQDGSYMGTLLSNYPLMQTYDVIFFNCGMDDSFLQNVANRAVAVANVRAFVASGKSIYASDWAYDLVEVGWPDFIDFYGEDATVDSAQLAKRAANAAGSVVDPALRNALGQTSVSINFNLNQWAVMTGVSANTRVYIRGNAQVCDDPFFCIPPVTLTNIPYTVGFTPSGGGKVIYTSFHQEEQTTADMDQILQMLVFEL